MKFTRRLSPSAKADLIPLIDVVFQLVIYFMVYTAFNIGPGIKIEYPESVTSEQISIGELKITLAGDDEIYINEDRIELENLGEQIAAFSQNFEEKPLLVLEGDISVSYLRMVEVMDELRKNGFYQIALRTTRKEE
jgi:biopolymer transport protein ExbD